MSKKHFETIAATLHQRLILAEEDREAAHVGEEGHAMACARVNEVTDTAEALAVEFYRHNPRFDVGRFLAACGVSR